MRTATTVLLALGLLALPPAASAQFVTFSVDFQSPTSGGADGFGGVPAVGPGDILTVGTIPPGPNAPFPAPFPGPPGVEATAVAGGGGTYPGGLGIPVLAPGFEIDALSFGRDVGTRLLFSVDEFAIGVMVPLRTPDVFTEGAAGAREASADVFAYLGPLALTPPPLLGGNTRLFDGDGGPPGSPSLGLIEPNPPTPGAVPDPGDNLDAFDIDTVPASFGGPIYFSLDSGFADPVEGPPVNLGSAPGIGFSGADVLVSFLGGAFPAVAIPAGALGLDAFGFDTDDLDALLFFDADGSMTLTPPDFIAFSVRRGSAVIGTLDSTQALPIEECDVLTVPAGPLMPPSILIPCEAMALANLRAGTFGPDGPDDLDALDVYLTPTFSVDFQGPMVSGGFADAWGGLAFTSGDIISQSTALVLAPVGGTAIAAPGPNAALAGPLPVPGIEIGGPAGAGGAIPGGLGIAPGVVGGAFEMDALSYGRDHARGQLVFSVDEFAVGIAIPNIATESHVAFEGAGGAREASADIFEYRGPIATLPIPVPAPYVQPINGSTQMIDGDGLPAATPPAGGLGLFEPNPPTPFVLADPGDNVDAIDLDTQPFDLLGPVFLSLDGGFPDPLEPFPPANNDAATATGLAVAGAAYSGADVLLSFAGAAPLMAIPAGAMGLDLNGPGTDDLDALVFGDADGTLTLTPGDTLFFSVRRGSAVVGMIDSGPLGAPISPGDVLTVPTFAGAPPAIAVNAEAMGLATVRAGLVLLGDDDLDGLDLLTVPEPDALLGLALGASLLATLGRRRLRR